MTFGLTPGQRHDTIGFEPLIEQGEVNRAGPGYPNNDRVELWVTVAITPRKSAYLRRRGIRRFRGGLISSGAALLTRLPTRRVIALND